jgi:polyphenol oxidase
VGAVDALPGTGVLRGTLAVPHGVTLRDGGVSRAPFDSLNLGASVGDDPVAVTENRRRVARHFGVEHRRVMRADQVHGAVVLVAGEDALGREGDALVSDDPAWLLAVGAADCLPVLVHDTRRGAVGAVHAGWRGAVAGVAVAAIAEMASRYGSHAGELDVWFGPAIRGACYQVGPEVIEAVVAAGGAAEAWWPDPTAPDRFRLDVPALVRAQLEGEGVPPARIADSGVCTHCDPRCYSHRRDRGRTGRHWAVIRAAGHDAQG